MIVDDLKAQGVYEGQDYLPNVYHAWTVEEETEGTPSRGLKTIYLPGGTQKSSGQKTRKSLLRHTQKVCQGKVHRKKEKKKQTNVCFALTPTYVQ